MSNEEARQARLRQIRAAQYLRHDGIDQKTRILLALDYGTTFTGVAYANDTGRDDPHDVEIAVITNWPGRDAEKVPSELSYSHSKKRYKQYGYEIDDDSHVLSMTKLEFQESYDRARELRAFHQTLYGLSQLQLNDEAAVRHQIPPHLSKNEEDIARDYLVKVATVVVAHIRSEYGTNVMHRIPVDMIITHPAQWSRSELNMTYRAVMGAFTTKHFPKLRNISFISEPEACAHYTLRTAQALDHERFDTGDCFIVVDAGGGTVDLASYQITELDTVNRQFKMEQIAYISGDSCGSTCVDRAFNGLVKQRLDPADSEKLIDPGRFGDGGHYIRKPEASSLLKNFITIKHMFDGNGNEMTRNVQLPDGIATLNKEESGVKDGNIILSADDLRNLFDPSVDKTLALIAGQMRMILAQDQTRIIKSIFLSGGYGKNEYLFSRVTDWAAEQGVDVERGDGCWSAVAQGAVMKGLGLLTSKPEIIIQCPWHFGIKTRTHYAAWCDNPGEAEIDVEGVRWATEQIRWLFNKGDAIVPSDPATATYDCHWTMPLKEYPATKQRRSWKDNGYIEPPAEVVRDIVFVASKADHAPTRFADRSDEDVVTNIKCDLTRIPRSHYEILEKKPSGKYMKFQVAVDVVVSKEDVVVRVVSGREKDREGDTIPGREGQELTSVTLSLNTASYFIPEVVAKPPPTFTVEDDAVSQVSSLSSPDPRVAAVA